MKRILILITFITSWTFIKGQQADSVPVNTLSLEVGKTGLIYSIAFDRKPKANFFGWRFSAGTNFSKYLKAFSTFLGSYYLVGRNGNNLELGIDVGYLSVNENETLRGRRAYIFPDYSIKTYYVNCNIGYRKYWNKGMFRVGTAPGYSRSGPVPGAYIGFGLKL